MASELLPCPKCGRGVTGRLCGGPAAYGCREWDYEVECECGLMWDISPGDVDDKEAVRQGIEAWNERVERTCRPLRSSQRYLDSSSSRWYFFDLCSSCGYTLRRVYPLVRPFDLPRHCPGCGSRIEGEDDGR